MISAALYDLALALGERRGMAERRRALLAPVSGRVLEVGAGSGLNLEHYPAVDELVLTEPDDTMRTGLERRVARSRREARIVAASAESLPFPDASFDVVVSTMVLCTVGDPAAAIREIGRVLRPGGRLVFIEHVRSSSEGGARRQDLWARPWRFFGQGCRCNQPTVELLEEGPLRVDQLSTAAWDGMPRLVRPLVIGSARP